MNKSAPAVQKKQTYFLSSQDSTSHNEQDYYHQHQSKQKLNVDAMKSDSEESLSDKNYDQQDKSLTVRCSSINYNRKEKSLGELSRRFLVRYGTQDQQILYLDQCTKELKVERRRIYDIINILESFKVIKRKAKNSYEWRGIQQVVASISTLIESHRQNRPIFVPECAPDLRKVCSEQVRPTDLNQELQDLFVPLEKGRRSMTKRKTKGLDAQRREKSLGLLCQQFIELFFSWKNVISLEEAAKFISGPEIEDQKLKTKIRRLYDIANVLQSIGLIQKTQQLYDSKKPAFEWIGVEGVQDFVSNLLSHRSSPTSRTTSASFSDPKPFCIKRSFSSMSIPAHLVKPVAQNPQRKPRLHSDPTLAIKTFDHDIEKALNEIAKVSSVKGQKKREAKLLKKHRAPVSLGAFDFLLAALSHLEP